jgi:transcriptional regulator GlxA family with amidase domain
VVVVALSPLEELDLVGPVQVLSAANRLVRRRPPPYAIELVSVGKDRTIRGEGGLVIQASRTIGEIAPNADSILVVCGTSSRNAGGREFMHWLRTAADRSRRVGGVCVAAFLLARAGLLAGRRAGVHWKYAHELARRFPDISVDPESVWVRDGNIYTSSGFTAGIDLALAWVEEDCGARVAFEVARELVLFLRRPSTQSQVSVSLAAQSSDAQPLHELRVWIAEHLSHDLSSAALARRASMSPRTFTRTFAREVGTTPARYVLHLRVEAARRLLDSRRRGLKQVAAAVGFGSADVMRRAFIRVLGSAPSALRNTS